MPTCFLLLAINPVNFMPLIYVLRIGKMLGVFAALMLIFLSSIGERTTFIYLVFVPYPISFSFVIIIVVFIDLIFLFILLSYKIDTGTGTSNDLSELKQ